jgi:hypothetical protein
VTDQRGNLGHKHSGWSVQRGRKGIDAYFNTKAVYIGLERAGLISRPT